MKLLLSLPVIVMLTVPGCNKVNIDTYSKPASSVISFRSFDSEVMSSNAQNSGALFFPIGYKTCIYITEHNSLGPYTGGTPSYATSDGNGNLITAKRVELKEGYYDIFSLSENTSFIPVVTIFNGSVTGLVNGKEYLLAKRSAVHVNKNTTVSLIFNHIASRILLFVTAEDMQTSVLIKSFRITLPEDQECILKLSEGAISPSESMGPYTEISGFGNIREVLLLPTRIYPQFKIEVELTTGTSPPVIKSYSGVINSPISGGVTYEVMLKIKKDLQLKTEISFYTTRILDNHIIFKSITN